MNSLVKKMSTQKKLKKVFQRQDNPDSKLSSKQVTTTWHDKKQALFGYLKIIIEWIFFVKTHKHISVFVAKKAEVEECMLEYTFLETFTDYFFRWEKLIARIFL